MSTFLLDRMMKQVYHLAHHHRSLHRLQDLEVLVSQALPTPSVMHHAGYALQLSLAHLIWIFFSISSLASKSSVYALPALLPSIKCPFINFLIHQHNSVESLPRNFLLCIRTAIIFLKVWPQCYTCKNCLYFILTLWSQLIGDDNKK